MQKILLALFLTTFLFLSQTTAQTVFRIVSLDQTNPQMIVGDGVTGDDGSAFAVSASSVFFTGDYQTGRFNLTDLGGGAGLPVAATRYTTLTSDVQTGKVFTFAASATEPITSNGGVTATHIIEMNAATGALTGNAVALSAPIAIGNGTGFFSGAGRILIDNRTRVYSVNPASGAVSDLASSPAVNPYLSESDGRYWGVTEFFGGASYMVYRRAGGHDIVRTRVSDGVTIVVQTFPNLGDMAQFAVSPNLQRWYYHAEGGIFFGSSGNQETIGYADAVIELSSANAPVIAVPYANQAIDEDQPTPIVLDADVRDNFSDPNNDPLTFLATTNNPNVTVAVAGNELRVTNLAANFSGTVSVSVTATDNRDGSATNSFNLVIAQINDLPVVSQPLPDQNIFANSATPLILDNNLDDNFSDVEGNLASFAATSDNANIVVATSGIRGTILRITSLAANYTGTANVTVTATDSNGATVSDVFVLRVNASPNAANDLFTITSLGTTGSNFIDANPVSGDDGSALAVGTNGVVFTGDTSSAVFSPADLSGGARYNVRYTTLTSELRSGKIYSFGTSATAPITSNSTVTATHLIEINAGTGAVLGAAALSQPITFTTGTGIFAGFRRLVVSNVDGYVLSIDPANGTVTNLGATPAIAPYLSESDSRFWGVAEFDGANIFLVYRRNGNDIVRTKVIDGVTTVVQSFTNLSDMGQFAVSLTRNRWYYHSEGGTQFGAAEEAVGYADATFNFASGNNTAPTISAPLADVSISEDAATPIIIDDNLTNNFSDADGDALEFQAETDNANVRVAITNGSQLVVSQLAANFTGAVNVTVSARDNRGGLISDSLILTVVSSDNDAPVNTVPPTQTTLQNRAINLSGSNGISIFDADAGNNPVKTTLSATSGTLTVEFVPNGLNVSGNGTNNVVLTGSVSNINLALNYLRYTPAQTFSGAATITVTTDDQGNSGPGTSQTDTDSFVINVVADNDFDGVPDADDLCANTAANQAVNEFGCAANQAVNKPANLQLWLTGDGDTRDFSGNTFNGTLNNGANFAFGKVGQAFNFDGVNDSINFPVPASVTGSGARTVEFWYKVAANQAFSGRELFYYGTFNSRKAFGIDIDDTPLSGSGTLRLKFFNSVDTRRFDTGIAPGEFTHLAVTYDGATGLRVYSNGTLREVFTIPAPLNTTSEVGILGSFGGYFNGQLDEVSLYDRELTTREIRAIVSVGAGGKLKAVNTSAGSNVQTQITSATISFPSVTTAGATTEIPLDGANLPTLPGSSNSRALFIDVSTAAVYTGPPTVCFNVPAFTAAQLSGAKLYHLENGVWINRTGTLNGSQICSSGLSGLSPFAIVPAAPPTAAEISISGRVVTPNDLGLTNALVTLTDSSGNTITVKTGKAGVFVFREVAAGQTYILTVSSKKYTYAPQVVSATENIAEISFTPQ